MNIIDFQQLHIEFPQTFLVPSREELDKIDSGDLVRICVDNERFWVRVLGTDGEKVNGFIYSDMLHTIYHGLKGGDAIEFEKKNIYSINIQSQKP